MTRVWGDLEAFDLESIKCIGIQRKDNLRTAIITTLIILTLSIVSALCSGFGVVIYTGMNIIVFVGLFNIMRYDNKWIERLEEIEAARLDRKLEDI